MKPAGRQRVFDLDGGWCHYGCGERAQTLDHIAPRSSGGPSCQWNLVGACKDCNGFKRSLRGVCVCFRCIEAERLFEGYTRPAQVPRRKRREPKRVEEVKASYNARLRKVNRDPFPITSSPVCHKSPTGQHERSYSGMGDFCIRCSEVLALPA